MTILLVPLLTLLASAPPSAAPATEPAPRRERAERGGEILQRAAADLEKLRRALQEVLDRVEDARDERDLVKLLCADEKLSRLKALVTVAERADVALAEAVATGDEGAGVERSKIAIARGKADAIRAEAAACIGQLAYDVGGKTRVVVEGVETLPGIGPDAAPDPIRSDEPFRYDFGIPSQARR